MMIIDYNQFNLKLLTANNFKAVILAEDHKTFGPFVKEVINVYNPDILLTEHTAYANVDLTNKWSSKGIKDKLDEEHIPFTRYLDTVLDIVKDTNIKKLIGCDYNPGGENNSEKHLKFIRLVDRTPIKKSFPIREDFMENCFTNELNKNTYKILMSIGGEHLRNKEISGYPGVSKIIKKYKERDDILIVLFPTFL